MAKEKKIGLAVIGVLLAIFLVVLVLRLGGPSDESLASTGSEPEPAKSVSKQPPPAPQSQSSPPAARTTVLDASPASASAPIPAAGDGADWEVRTGAPGAGANPAREASASPHSYMPPSASAQASQPYGSFRIPTSESPTGDEATGAPGTAYSSQSYDSSQSTSAGWPTTAGDQTNPPPSANAGQNDPTAAAGGTGADDSAGYASTRPLTTVDSGSFAPTGAKTGDSTTHGSVGSDSATEPGTSVASAPGLSSPQSTYSGQYPTSTASPTYPRDSGSFGSGDSTAADPQYGQGSAATTGAETQPPQLAQANTGQAGSGAYSQWSGAGAYPYRRSSADTTTSQPGSAQGDSSGYAQAGSSQGSAYPQTPGATTPGYSQFSAPNTAAETFGATSPGTGAYGATASPSLGGTAAPNPYGSPAAPTLATNPLRRSDGTYVVQPNDTFWRISQRLYGNGGYFKALAEHNRNQVANPNQLQVGDRILAPGVAVLREKYKTLCPKPGRPVASGTPATPVSVMSLGGSRRVYVVQEGDTLFDIANLELGKRSRWPEIYALNREVIGEDFHFLRPGTRLVLPSAPAAASETVTSRPDSAYQR